MDVPAFTAIIRFLVQRGVRRFAVNGATGEFCLSTPTQLELLLATVQAVCKNAEVLCGVGGASAAQTREFAAIAERAGVHNLLLPMPYFFPYGQQDLAAFSQDLAQNVSLPVLLYNLPQFTTGLDAQTVCAVQENVMLQNTSTASDTKEQVFLVTSGDLRLSANQACWPAQRDLEQKLSVVCARAGYDLRRAFPVNEAEGHGFISSQRMGMDIFMTIPNGAKLVFATAAWQYSHHVLPGLRDRRGPILTVANWSGQWPGLVGLLNLNGSLVKAGVPFSSLWSRDFDDDFFRNERIHAGALIDFIEVHERTVWVKLGACSLGEDRWAFRVVQQAFHPVRRRRHVLEALLVLNADRITTEVRGDANCGDIHPALIDHVVARQFGCRIDAEVEVHALVEQPLQDGLRLVSGHVTHLRDQCGLAEAFLVNTAWVEEFVVDDGVVHAHAAFVEDA